MISRQRPPSLARRKPDSHKGDYGRVLIIAGSRGMSGAAALAGMAALRGGAGLVTVATAQSAAPIVAMQHPCYMTLALSEDEIGCIETNPESLRGALDSADVVAIGPGLGRSPSLTQLVMELWQTLSVPLVLDADALNAFAEHEQAASDFAAPAGPRIMTPHPGEFRRLQPDAAAGREALEQAAIEYAAARQAIVVLKGNETLVTNGHDAYHNTTGNPGMATGGSGDVFTGVVAALVAQSGDPLTATRQAVFIHGLAGDLAASEFGEVSMTALDLLEHLPRAFCNFSP